MTLYCSAPIFPKTIPLRTKYCLSAASLFCLGIVKERKIAEPYSVLTFFASFFVSRQKMKNTNQSSHLFLGTQEIPCVFRNTIGRWSYRLSSTNESAS